MRRSLAVAMFLASSAGFAQTGEVPKALICSFQAVSVSNFAGDWTDEETEQTPFDLTFAAIDPENARAQIVGNAGAAAVSIVLVDDKLHLIEPTPAGNLSITTIWLGAEERYPAVHSRHMSMIESRIISQYRGFCEPRF